MECLLPSVNWWHELIIAIIGSLIVSVATLSAVIITLRHERQKDKLKKKQLQIERLLYFQSLTKNITRELKSQIKSLEIFVSTLESKPLETFPLLTQEVLNDLSRIVHEIKQEKYYHAYLGQLGNSNEKREEFIQIISLLDFFDAVINQIRDSVKRAIEFDYDKRSEYENSLEKVTEALILFQRSGNLSSYPVILSEINNIVEKFVTSTRSPDDIKFPQENYVKPIQEKVLPLFANPQIHDLLIQLKKISSIYVKIKNQNLFIADDFKNIKNDLENQLAKFLIATKSLEEFNSNSI